MGKHTQQEWDKIVDNNSESKNKIKWRKNNDWSYYSYNWNYNMV